MDDVLSENQELQVREIIAQELASAAGSALQDADVGAMTQDERENVYDAARRLLELTPIQAEAFVTVLEAQRQAAARSALGFLLQRAGGRT